LTKAGVLGIERTIIVVLNTYYNLVILGPAITLITTY